MPAVADTFRPWFWLKNPHVQTVLGVYWKGSAFPHASVRRRVRLSDGDQLVLLAQLAAQVLDLARGARGLRCRPYRTGRR